MDATQQGAVRLAVVVLVAERARTRARARASCHRRWARMREKCQLRSSHVAASRSTFLAERTDESARNREIARLSSAKKLKIYRTST